ncbi:DUF1996 domain-containing protein [Amycolatopsis sp. H20-H5]|uniref:DUF1996 domain-containing protein n=1 Tax=Amycolatopsis sp. H20-H5 TaxID=3046309 RepID=UPI002DB94710|nr:DUF1996 domain-containing protein [Amycolatopsis sp. H20-H5]MEC3976454.1 DUF1996 domain-containing protein [Amycolatopsis sp. H20-H5]
MAPNRRRSPATGRHRITRRTKIATGAIGLAIAVGALAVVTTTGSTGDASADPADQSFFLDIAKVPAGVNVNKALLGKGAKGTFTVNCGKNENGHFNPDNFIAQPGIRNGAQHLHDYVGNLSANADSNNKSLLKSGTTCKNGDKSAYFWPVVRIDTGDEEKAAANSAGKDPVDDRAGAAKDAVAPQVDCPDVASKLPEVPDQAMDEVNQNLDQIDTQIDEANKRLAQGDLKNQADVQNAVLGPLKDKLKAIVDRIVTAIGRNAPQPADLGDVARCAVKKNGNGGLDNGGANSNTDKGATDAQKKEKQQNGKAQELPGVNDQNELAGNDGEIQRVQTAKITFQSGGARKVVAMPKFLRVLYGDAKEQANGPANARASWTCTGFEDRLTDHYPICPNGSKVERIHAFPNCWDGKNVDSANHRTHIVFSDQNGTCPRGFKNVPQLKITLVYNIPHDIQVKGQYKVDAFPEESHNPRSDHDDFANVMSQSQMTRVVSCINNGKRCAE